MSDGADSIRPEALLEHEGWLRALARALVRDPNDADDVAQQTWLAALEHPPRPGGSVRGWLGRVARNAVHRIRRADRRRGRREERAMPPSGWPDPADVAARVEIARRLAELIGTLEEPYRTVITLRYLEGWGTAEIAERSGRTASTVRSQVERGLGKLRRVLDREHGDKRRAWVMLLAPLALDGWRVEGASRSRAITTRRIGLLMGFAGTIGLVLLTTLAFRESRTPPEASSTRGQPDARVRPENRGRPVGEVEGSPRARSAHRRDDRGLDHRALELPGRLSGRVLLGECGSPCPNARVHATPISDDVFGHREEDPHLEALADEAGRYVLEDLPPGSYEVVAMAPSLAPARGQGPINVGPGDRKAMDLISPPAASVYGIVLDSTTEAPIAGAVLRIGKPASPSRLLATTDQAGRFRLAGVPAGNTFQCDLFPTPLIASAPGYAATSVRIRMDPAGRDVRCDVRLPQAASLSGTVLSETGSAVQDARLRVRVAGEWCEARSAADGTFTLANLPHGRHRISVDGPGHVRMRSGVVSVAPGGATNRVDLTMRLGGVVEGVVSEAGGEPIEGARVECHSLERGDLAEGGHLVSPIPLTTGRDGRFVFRGVPPGRCRISAASGRHACGHSDEIRISARSRVEVGSLVLPRGLAVAGTVRTPRGEPVIGATVLVLVLAPPARPSGLGRLKSHNLTRTDDAGRFRVEGLADSPCFVSVRCDVGEAQCRTRSAEEALDLVLTMKRVVRGRVIDGSTGRPARAFWVSGTGYAVDPEGRFRVLTWPGERTISAATSDGRVSRPVEVRVGKESDPEPVELVLEAGGEVRGRIEDPEGEPVVGGTVQLHTPDGGRVVRTSRSGVSGAFAVGSLPPGPYEVRAFSRKLQGARRIRVSAGVSLEMDPLVLLPEANLESR